MKRMQRRVQLLDFIQPAVYFTISTICIFFSTALIIAQRMLKIHPFFRLLGYYLLCSSIVSMPYALIRFPNLEEHSRELLIIQRLVSLIAGYPLIKMIKSIKQDILSKRAEIVIFSLLASLFLVGFVDLVGHFKWLFYDPPPVIHITPLFRFVYIPFSFIALGGSYILMFIASKSLTSENKKLIRILFIGLALLLPFEFKDLINLLIKADPFNEAVFVFNPAIIIVFIFIFIFIIEFIRIHSRYAQYSTEKKKPDTETNSSEEDMELYRQIISLIERENLYKNPELTIDEIASKIDVNRNAVSRLINLHSGSNFKSLINKYRIDHMRELLENPDTNLTIKDMADMSGFNSKTSLNRIFLQYMGISPKEYRNRYLSESGPRKS